jgi:ATP-dependent DNA helicase RecG
VTVGAYPSPISYRGVYYLRSGSTTQELTGNALDEFMNRKQGKTWDGVPVPYVKVEDFYPDAFRVFREKAVSSKRLMPEDVEGNDAELLHRLKLVEGEYLLRAAPMVFHQDPDNWAIGSYVKIGYFANDADILYQDEIGGSLITVPDRVMDTIFTKYFIGLIHYEGIQRVDHYPMPRTALREAILNAVIHKDYSSGNPIQIRVYDDKVIIHNACSLPPDVTLKKLLEDATSKPHNPLIANAFFRSGQIETWGRGLEKIIEGCVADGLPEPEFRISPTMFTACFRIRNNKKAIAEIKAAQPFGVGKDGINDGISDGINGGINGAQKKILELIAHNPSITAEELSAKIGINKRNAEKNIKLLKDAGLIRREGSRKSGHWEIVK